MMVELDITPPFASQDIDSVGTPDEEVTTTLDVSAYVDTKIASLNCHRTQIDPNGPFAQLPEDMTRETMATEYYTLAMPENAGPGDDLLAGL
jgi:N-acetyl-1-D-myo-inositol-2-amino-2-deoxy-alpha-D-glucopyranoside deacetylase